MIHQCSDQSSPGNLHFGNSAFGFGREVIGLGVEGVGFAFGCRRLGYLFSRWLFSKRCGFRCLAMHSFLVRGVRISQTQPGLILILYHFRTRRELNLKRHSISRQIVCVTENHIQQQERSTRVGKK